jgi:HTH-type transcriptional regulator / antitoxin HipB
MNSEAKTTTQRLGQEIKARRKRLGLNQAELAMVSGTGVRFISDLENGKPSCELGKTLSVLANLGLGIQITTHKGA